MKLNVKFLFLSIGLFLVELSIALFVRDNFIRPYVGDVLVVILIYCVIRTFVRRKIKLLPLYVFLFAVFVEILQFFDIVSLLRLENNVIAKTVIGSFFDWVDILCYFIGFVILMIIQRCCVMRCRQNRF